MPMPSIFLTGATGFVGSHILAELLGRGHSVHCLVRDPAKLAPHSNVRPFRGSITDSASLPPAMAGCWAAIHLVGIIAETRNQKFAAVHTQGTQNVINAAQQASITRYIHMSALGTRPTAASPYHQTKWAAEELIRHSPLAWTIFRPGLILGEGGEFTDMLDDWAYGKVPPYFFMPFFGAGLFGQSNPFLLQPVCVQDVAWLFCEALTTPASLFQVYEVGGPERFSWKELLRRAAAVNQDRRTRVIGIPAWWAKCLLALHLPLPFNRDQVLMSQEPNTADNSAVLHDFPALELQDAFLR